jgi:hypothetical protein
MLSKCITPEDASLVLLKGGDVVCNGRYVWKCKDTSSQDWCNIYPVNSEFVFLAWQLIDAIPDPIVKEVPKTNTTEPVDVKPPVFYEPSDARLKAQMTQIALWKDFEQVALYVVPVTIKEFWDNFYANVSLFYSNEGFVEALGSYNSWHFPTEDKFKTFRGTTV